jgi:hypothetical protein
MNQKINVFLVLKKGGDFSFKDVDLLTKRLYEQNRGKVNVYCLTEVEKEMKLKDLVLVPFTNPEWPGWWSKMNLFSPELEEYRPFLYLDLDTACVGSLDFLDVDNKGFGMLQDFHRSSRPASGVMWIPKENKKVSHIWGCWIKDSVDAMKRYRGDQDFIESVVAPDFYFQRKYPGRIFSFKPTRKNWLQQIPSNASLVCFHGQPRIWQAAESVQWVAKYIDEGIPVRGQAVPFEKINKERVDALPYVRPWFSLLCPTRERPAMALRYLESVFATAKNPEYVEVLFYVDSDDPCLRQYVELLSTRPNCKLVVGPNVGVGRAWNVLARMSDGEYLMMANDDLVHETFDWDFKLLTSFVKIPDGIFLAYCNDGINGEAHCAFPIVGRAWLEELNQFVPECYTFFRHDTELFEIAKQMGISERILYFSDILIKHYHHSVTGAEDATMKRNRNCNQNEADKKIFESRKQYNIRRNQAHRLLWAIRMKQHYNDELFTKLVKDKRIALVGSSPHLQGKGEGKIIDDYDLVCRINEIYPFDMEEDYGSKTDVVFYGCNTKNYTNFEKTMNFLKENRSDVLDNLKAFVIVQRRKDTANIGAQQKFLRLLDKYAPHVDHFVISLYHWEFYHRWIKTHPNSGILAMCMLAQKHPKELYVTGFSFYTLGLKPEQRHYKAYIEWGGDKGDNERTIEKIHDQETQMVWFQNQFLPTYKDIVVLDSFLKELFDR